MYRQHYSYLIIYCGASTDAADHSQEATLLPPSGLGSFFVSPLKVLHIYFASVLSFDIFLIFLKAVLLKYDIIKFIQG